MEGTTIHKEVRATEVYWYYYNQTGVTAMEFEGMQYYFQKNFQNDVARIVNREGNLVATYQYDA